MDNDSGKVFIPRPVAAAMGSHKNILVMGTKRKVVRLTIVIKEIIPFLFGCKRKNCQFDYLFLYLFKMNKFKNYFVVCKPFQPLQKKNKDSSEGLNTKSWWAEWLCHYTKKLIAKNNNEIQYCAQNLLSDIINFP